MTKEEAEVEVDRLTYLGFSTIVTENPKLAIESMVRGFEVYSETDSFFSIEFYFSELNENSTDQGKGLGHGSVSGRGTGDFRGFGTGSGNGYGLIHSPGNGEGFGNSLGFKGGSLFL